MRPEDVTNAVFLSLGGNLGNREAMLRKAAGLIGEKCGEITAASSLYETAPWGSDSVNQFLNMVIQLNTGLSPGQLLQIIRDTELQLGRRRSAERNADRSIDIDILLQGTNIVAEPELELPHPRFHLRKFVLVPMNEIAPALTHPVLKKTMAELLRACDDDLAVRRYAGW